MSALDPVPRARELDALRESEQRMRAIWETAVEGIVTIDERGIVESINPAACTLFGYRVEEIVGHNVSRLMPSPDRERHDGYIARYLRTGEARIIGIGREVTGQRKDGSRFPLELSVAEVRLGERRLFTGMVRDITERKRADVALRDSERRLQAILDTAVDGILTIDDRGIVESINPAACRTFGYTAEEVRGRNISMLMPSPYREQHDGYIANYLRTGEAKIIGIGREVTGQRKDGSLFPMELAVGIVQLGERRLFTGVVRDISARRELEAAVAAAAEQERARIARELHDGLGQQLGGLLFLMKGLHRDLADERSTYAETARQLGDELGTALRLARNLAHELYAVPATPDGLMRALENLADRTAGEHGPDCAFIADQDVLVSDPAVASHLFRIAQEAVHNALKHARAGRIELSLARRDDALVLAVRDNGRGLPAGPPTHGLGWRSMEQRARLLGGQLTIGPAPGGGVAVTCTVPELKAGERAAEAPGD